PPDQAGGGRAVRTAQRDRRRHDLSTDRAGAFSGPPVRLWPGVAGLGAAQDRRTADDAALRRRPGELRAAGLSGRLCSAVLGAWSRSPAGTVACCGAEGSLPVVGWEVACCRARVRPQLSVGSAAWCWVEGQPSAVDRVGCGRPG